MRLFLTGAPGIGKTTVVRSIMERLKGVRCAGFYTEEVRRDRERVGFKIITLDGKEGTLASLGKGVEPRVGKYAVRVEEFERLVLLLLDPKITPVDLYVIDEIGKMELLSEKFIQQLTELLARPTHLLATIANKGRGLIEQLKSRRDIEVVKVTGENRERLPEELAQRILREFEGRHRA